MATAVDRTREREVYDLARAQRARGVLVDCPTGRMLALGLAAVGCPALLLERPGDQRAAWARYLIPPDHGLTDSPAAVFAHTVVPRWFTDARLTPAPLPAEEGGLLRLMARAGADGVPLLVVPLEETGLVEAVYEAVAAGALAAPSVRIVATGPRGCALVIPDPARIEAQVDAMAAVIAGERGNDPLALDASLIAAGMLLHEARLLTGATVGAGLEERPAEDVCALVLPEAPTGASVSAVCVGAGGIGGLLALLGIAPAARPGDHLTLVDGDTVAQHNLLLSRWWGRPKVEALERELLAASDALAVETIPRMVDGQTRLPRADVSYAVTDSAHSRLLAARALPDRAGPLVCAGSSLDGAEAFVAGGGPACVACRYPPGALAAPAGGECARSPALFASNMIAAGLALAIGRRVRSGVFLQSDRAACRFRASTLRGDRFVAELPQRCAHR